ncbi:hypothetical protein EJB05_44701, partial [Eragrostis curvula]
MIPHSSSHSSSGKMLQTTAYHAPLLEYSNELLRQPANSAIALLPPVVDMSSNRDEVCRAILDGGKEFGFIQVVNHGVPEQAIRDMELVSQEFFQLSAADKAHLYSEDTNKPTRFFSGTTFETGGDKYSMNTLRLAYSFPNGDSSKEWPSSPPKLREVAMKYMELTRGLGMELLRLLCEGLGLRSDYFEGDISRGDTALSLFQYPPSSDPSMTLGLPPHCDRNLITILLPSAVKGLQILYNGDWIDAQSVPNAFIVNFGLQLEVVTNGILKSIEHRVVTNSVSRLSIGTFIHPTENCLIGPADEFLTEDNLPLYRAMTFGDFKRIYNVIKLDSSLNLTTNLRDIQENI